MMRDSDPLKGTSSLYCSTPLKSGLVRSVKDEGRSGAGKELTVEWRGESKQQQ